MKTIFVILITILSTLLGILFWEQSQVRCDNCTTNYSFLILFAPALILIGYWVMIGIAKLEEKNENKN